MPTLDLGDVNTPGQPYGHYCPSALTWTLLLLFLLFLCLGYHTLLTFTLTMSPQCPFVRVLHLLTLAAPPSGPHHPSLPYRLLDAGPSAGSVCCYLSRLPDGLAQAQNDSDVTSGKARCQGQTVLALPSQTALLNYQSMTPWQHTDQLSSTPHQTLVGAIGPAIRNVEVHMSANYALT